MPYIWWYLIGREDRDTSLSKSLYIHIMPSVFRYALLVVSGYAGDVGGGRRIIRPKTESEVSWCVVQDEVSSRAMESSDRGRDINTATKLNMSDHGWSP